MKPVRFDLSVTRVRELNDYLHHRLTAEGVRVIEILNPNGMHNLAVGLDCPVEVHVRGRFAAGSRSASEHGAEARFAAMRAQDPEADGIQPVSKQRRGLITGGAAKDSEKSFLGEFFGLGRVG